MLQVTGFPGTSTDSRGRVHAPEAFMGATLIAWLWVQSFPSSPGGEVGRTAGQVRESGRRLSRFEFEETHMASAFHLVLYSTDDATARRASRAAFDRIEALNAVLSDYDPESALSKLSRSAGGPPAKVEADLFDVLARSKRMYERSGGAFDVTIAPVGRLWRARAATGSCRTRRGSPRPDSSSARTRWCSTRRHGPSSS